MKKITIENLIEGCGCCIEGLFFLGQGVLLIALFVCLFVALWTEPGFAEAVGGVIANLITIAGATEMQPVFLPILFFERVLGKEGCAILVGIVLFPIVLLFIIGLISVIPEYCDEIRERRRRREIISEIEKRIKLEAELKAKR